MKICYYSDIDDKEIEVEIKIGNTYNVICTDYGNSGDTICEFSSVLKDIILEGKEETIYIDELIFENGVTICQPQYHHSSVTIILK